MARLTLDQINALIPNDSAILLQNGITQTVGDDGNPVYRDSEGQKVNPGQIEQILSGRDQARQQALTQNGIIQLPSEQGDFSFFNQSNGTNFQNLTDYYNYLYGGGDQIGNVGTQDGSYYVLPEGQSTTDYKNAPLSYNPPPSTGYRLAQMGVLGLAGAGLGGFLPGTESVFGGLGGAGAAEGAGALAGEAAPVFTGGASGAGIAGGALGGVPAGLSTAELAALGIGGTGAAAAGAGAGGFNVADFIANGTLPGGGSVAVPSLPAGSGIGASSLASGGSALSRLLDGTATTADYLSLGGNLAGTLGGLASSNQQAGAFADLANRGWAEGAPSRARYEASFAPGFDLLKADPLLQGGLDTAANTAARAWSAKAGNPADSPTAQAEIQKYLLGSVYLPQGNAYRSQNATSGQFGTNLAGTASTNQINAQGGGWEALGSGLEGILNPKQNPLSSLSGILNGFKLNNSMSF